MFHVVLQCKILGVAIQFTSTPFDPNIPIDELNKQAYMFLDLEKENNESYSMEPFGIAKESLLSTSTCLECHPKNNF